MARTRCAPSRDDPVQDGDCSRSEYSLDNPPLPRWRARTVKRVQIARTYRLGLGAAGLFILLLPILLVFRPEGPEQAQVSPPAAEQPLPDPQAVRTQVWEVAQRHLDEADRLVAAAIDPALAGIDRFFA